MKRLIRHIIGNRRFDYLIYSRYYRQLLLQHGFANKREVGEEAYLNKWRLLGRVEPYSYRLFSHFCGNNPCIMPEDICHNVIEPKLNPVALWDEYEDKNNFVRYIGEENLPRTVMFRQNGDDIQHVASPETDYLFLKPSLGTSCGEGIIRINANDIDEDELMNYCDNFVLQEAVEQHSFLSQFCQSSVNTIRLVVYRSVVDGSPHVTAAVLRIGKDGSVVDNTVAGGRFLTVDISTGRLGDTVFDKRGFGVNEWNGVDFKNNTFVIPCWQDILDFSKMVADRIRDHHLIALDVSLTNKEKPILIEYNIGGFSSWLFHFTGQTCLGPFTDEVISYCLSR